MAREIKVRKKRFAAFWTAVLLVCSLVIPTTVHAESIKIADLTVGSILQPDTIITSEGSTYSITYSEGDSYEGSEDHTVPAYPGDLEGKSFDGWKVTSITSEDISGVIYYNIGLSAQLSTASYTITWIVDGVESTETYEYGATPSFKGSTEKAATDQYTYTFTGWSPAIEAVTGDATYTATYTETANRYTITFNTAGGSEVAAITQDYGTAVTVPADPTKAGYSFAGWDSEIPETMPAEDITITAQWVANTYYIRYELDGGTNGSNPPMYTYGEGVASFADAVKEGYTFEGWYSDASFTAKVESVAATQMGDVDLYAKFVYVPAVIEAGTYELAAGVQYQLGNVTKVSGDSSVYVSGSTFYVPTSGTYTFS